jgi:hypothetical protein
LLADEMNRSHNKAQGYPRIRRKKQIRADTATGIQIAVDFTVASVFIRPCPPNPKINFKHLPAEH